MNFIKNCDLETFKMKLMIYMKTSNLSLNFLGESVVKKLVKLN